MIFLLKNNEESPHYLRASLNMIDDMHRKRYKVFHERLGWDVKVNSSREFDQFDNENTQYIAAVYPETGVYAGIRLIPTTFPYMMKNVFSSLVREPEGLPANESVWELSRFFVFQLEDACISPERLRKASAKILAAVMEICLERGVQKILTVTDLRVERIVSNLGWRFKRLGEPKILGNTHAVACEGEISREIYENFIKKNGISQVVFELHDENIGYVISSPVSEELNQIINMYEN